MAWGCGDDSPPATDGGLDASVEAGQDDAATDTGPPDAGPPGDICDELGFPREPMEESTGFEYGDVAGDFAVQTLDGSFTLGEAWTGCESYVFVNYAATGEGDAIWSSFPDPLFSRSARNAQYFFASYETDPAAVRTRMETLRSSFETAFAMLEAEEASFWRERIHFVTDPLLDIEGSAGDRARNQPGIAYAFAIDRDQRFDQVGSLAEVTGAGFVPRLGMAAWASHYYNYRATLRARLAAETGVTLVPLVSEVDWTERVFDRTATLPDTAAMAAFDTLEVDISITCRQNARGCSEWDRIGAIDVCLDDTCDTRRELVRWITPYSRPGRRRWVIDASPLLGLLRAGGDQPFRVVMGPAWEAATPRDVEMSIRLSDRGGADSASGAELAFTGGTFDAAYDSLHPPFRFTPPSGTTRVELVVIVSGHGQTDVDNCAEWCNHEHTFTVNGGTDHRVDFPGEAGRATGCAERVVDGVIPGQYGNWAPSRAGWCPGFPVAALRFDVTGDAHLSAENELTYDASFAGGEPRGGNIDLSTYVVYYQ